jgi:hypothetical protein
MSHIKRQLSKVRLAPRSIIKKGLALKDNYKKDDDL